MQQPFDRDGPQPASGVTIAVASGKGGAGKTTLATNLARVASQSGYSVGYLDTDVEEPNGALFLKPVIGHTRPVEVSVPRVDTAHCTGCGECGRICQFNAIAVINGQPMIFAELCHGCGGCWLVCPERAITESRRRTGRIETGHAGSIKFVQGILNIGEAMSPPVIRAAKRDAPAADWLFIDSPPGISCPVIESVRDADFVLLVAEPTPFGLNDLSLAVEMLRAVERPFAIVINRSDGRESALRHYCRRETIDILAVIDDDRRAAEACSRGELICDTVPGYRAMFTALLTRIGQHVRDGRPDAPAVSGPARGAR